MKKTILRTHCWVYVLLPLIILLAGTTFAAAQNIDFGKSYINVTKGLNGGTVETGDTLEIRASFVVRAGTYDSCRYQDAVPAGTTYIPGTVRVLTNEGKIYKQFTDAYGDDPGWITGGNITINLGYNTAAAPATAFRRGRVANTHKPSFFGSSCIMVASFRVKVTALTNSTISTGGGNMTYKNGAAAITTFTFPANTVAIYPNYGICSNTIGTNALGTEFNGTFGSGKPRNRGASANVPVGYTYQTFTINSPNDYTYGVANNTSTDVNYTTVNTWPKPDASSPTHRVFQLWDIIGDHTGAASPSAGNPAADTVANANAGYMLVVNAAYRIDSAFQQTITGLCPNTYYEISCWMRNICSKCGCDSNGKGATNAAGPPYYIPTGTGDSSGVAPNITFEVNGVDYYTTGNILYSGQWVKKGFTYLTGAAQTSFTLKYFNNAPGGGGNDWALDDIAVSTCSPNMKYTPNTNPTVCDSNTLLLTDTVRSYFNNYVYYKWQRSTDGGITWTDVTAAFGPIVPYWNAAVSAWEYVSSYVVPPAYTRPGNNGNKYRLVTSTTLANLANPSCSFTDQGSIVTINVITCGVPLKVKLLSFSGQLVAQGAALNWSTGLEDEPVVFDVLRSNDGVNFTLLTSMNARFDNSSEVNNYSYLDPAPGPGKNFYKVIMRNNSGQTVSSRTIQLSLTKDNFSFVAVINPFLNQLVFEVNAAGAGKAEAELIDATGKIAAKKVFDVTSGVNHLVLEGTDKIPSGIYYLRVISAGFVIQRTVMKQSNP
ncbi:MAG: T9SS type A sorting domain-containing protein [Chitinophagaceae bacterium]